MPQKKEDRRTERTKKAIKLAFTQLIIEKDFKEISVTELAEKANINRKTFYSHYECIEDVLDELQENIIERVLAIYNKNNYGRFDITAFTRTINEILAEDYNLYRRLVVANEYRFFSRKIKNSLKEAFIAYYLQNYNADEGYLDLVAEYCVAGLIKIYRVWFEERQDIGQEEISRLAATLVWGGMKAAMEEVK